MLASEDLSITIRDEAPVTVVVVGGEIDLETAPELHRQLLDIIADGRTQLILELTAVTFLDSTALGVLISANRRIRALDGYLDVVTGPRPLVSQVFRVTGLHKVFGLHETLEQALVAH